MGKLFVLLIITVGVWDGMTWAKNAKGYTVRDVPIIMTKSASFSIIFGALWNYLGRLSPKNTISGFTRPLQS